MKLQPGTPLSVRFLFDPSQPEIPLGRLAIDRVGVVQLEFDATFVGGPTRLNPREEPVPGILAARDPSTFDGLHGVFADSLPDAWGRALLRRRAETLGVRFATLRGIDLLACVGRRGPGALVYAPAFAALDASPDAIDLAALDRLADDARAIEVGQPAQSLDTLVRLGGPSGGARPKILVALNAAGDVRADEEALPPGYASWIVKFRSVGIRKTLATAVIEQVRDAVGDFAAHAKRYDLSKSTRTAVERGLAMVGKMLA